MEDGTITLIGATTENPSFSVNSALISRCRVVVLDKLSPKVIIEILSRALEELKTRIRNKEITREITCSLDEMRLESLKLLQGCADTTVANLRECQHKLRGT